MRRLPRADHRGGVFVLRGQLAIDVKHERRIVNLAEQRGLIFIRRNQDVAAEIRYAFQFAREVNGFLPTGNRPGGFVADVADAEQFGFGGGEDSWRVAEMFEQEPRTHRPDVFNHVQSDERFAGIHAVLITIGGRGGKNCFALDRPVK